MKKINLKLAVCIAIIAAVAMTACKPKNLGNAVSADAAAKRM